MNEIENPKDNEIRITGDSPIDDTAKHAVALVQEHREIRLKARGSFAICNAVYVAESIKRINPELRQVISAGTQKITDCEGNTTNPAVISITLSESFGYKNQGMTTYYNVFVVTQNVNLRNYVAPVMEYLKERREKAVLKAVNFSISKAVGLAQYFKHWVPGLQEHIDIGTEQFMDNDTGKPRHQSVILITLSPSSHESFVTDQDKSGSPLPRNSDQVQEDQPHRYQSFSR